MNKTIWMCWFQGPQHARMPAINRACLAEWPRLNPCWNVIQLCNRTLDEYAPDYAATVAKAPSRLPATCSEILRLELLERYGGVWADASVWPARPLDGWLPEVLAPTGFFGFRYVPRDAGSGIPIDVNSWFLAVDRSHHPLICKWRSKFVESFLAGLPQGSKPSSGKDCSLFPYFQMHGDITDLYDNDTEIARIIDGMPRISVKGPLSASGRARRIRAATVYKRPAVRALNRIRYRGPLPQTKSALPQRP